MSSLIVFSLLARTFGLIGIRVDDDVIGIDEVFVMSPAPWLQGRGCVDAVGLYGRT